MESTLTLKILLPHKICADVKHLSRIIAETDKGSFGILPNRLDCVAALVPGILLYETEGGKKNYVAIDEGILVKTGSEVCISVRNAVGGKSLEMLNVSVEEKFKKLNEQEKEFRSAIVKLESGFMHAFEKFRRD